MQVKSGLGVLTWGIFFCLVHVNLGWAQGDGERVVELIDGIQYEGRVFQIPSYSETVFATAPYLAGGNEIVGVNDGLRTIFLYRHIIKGVVPSVRNDITFSIPQREYKGDIGVGDLLFAGKFNEYGHREFVVNEPSKGRVVQRTHVQGITEITPRFCTVNTLLGSDTPARRWQMSLKTSTIPKNILRGLLLNRVGRDSETANDYFDLADFFSQAGDFQQAKEEYIQLVKKFPNQGDRVREQRIKLDQLLGRQILSEIRTRIDAGQNIIGVEFAKAKDTSDLAFDIQAQYQQIQDDYVALQEKVNAARKKVLEAIKEVNGLKAEQQEAVTRFGQEIETELNQYNLARLDAFLLTAKSANAVPSNNLAKAMSGWLVGSNKATENLAVATTMYRGRDLALEYLQTETTAARRQEILAELAASETGAPDYIDALLKNAKPVEDVDLSEYDASKPIEFWVEFEGTKARPQPWRFRCLAHLPPEYSPYRKYPTILTLCDGGRTPLENFFEYLVRFAQQCAFLKTRFGRSKWPCNA